MGLRKYDNKRAELEEADGEAVVLKGNSIVASACVVDFCCTLRTAPAAERTVIAENLTGHGQQAPADLQREYHPTSLPKYKVYKLCALPPAMQSPQLPPGGGGRAAGSLGLLLAPNARHVTLWHRDIIHP
jgi:hypothetical protein